MSKHQAKRAIRAEIERLNQEIDLKIIRGVSYKREAVRHKFLMRQLSMLSRAHSFWFSSPLKFVSTFLF